VIDRIKRKLLFRAEGIDTRISKAFARAAATAAARQIDPKNPISWEFAGFSQQGEDGVHDYLCTHLLKPNRWFFEIGSYDGLENCTTWFATARGYGGVMVEGNTRRAIRLQRLVSTFLNVYAVHQMVNLDNIANLMKMCPMHNPDLFVIDIDSTDFHILKKVLELGYRPKILTVEYNSAFGPDEPITIPYKAMFDRSAAHPTALYYGVSIAAWRKLLEPIGYQFLTVGSNGVNAFFANPAAFPEGFLAGVRGPEFLENFSDVNATTYPFFDTNGVRTMPERNWRKQFEQMKDMEFFRV